MNLNQNEINKLLKSIFLFFTSECRRKTHGPHHVQFRFLFLIILLLFLLLGLGLIFYLINLILLFSFQLVSLGGLQIFLLSRVFAITLILLVFLGKLVNLVSNSRFFIFLLSQGFNLISYSTNRYSLYLHVHSQFSIMSRAISMSNESHIALESLFAYVTVENFCNFFLFVRLKHANIFIDI